MQRKEGYIGWIFKVKKMLEYSDFVNLAGIGFEIVGFFFLLPRIANWIKKLREPDDIFDKYDPPNQFAELEKITQQYYPAMREIAEQHYANKKSNDSYYLFKNNNRDVLDGVKDGQELAEIFNAMYNVEKRAEELKSGKNGKAVPEEWIYFSTSEESTDSKLEHYKKIVKQNTDVIVSRRAEKDKEEWENFHLKKKARLSKRTMNVLEYAGISLVMIGLGGQATSVLLEKLFMV